MADIFGRPRDADALGRNCSPPPRQTTRVFRPSHLHLAVGSVEIDVTTEGRGTLEDPVRASTCVMKIDGQPFTGLVQRVTVEIGCESTPVVHLTFMPPLAPPEVDSPVIVSDVKE